LFPKMPDIMEDIYADEHIVNEREMLVRMDQPGIGELTVTNNPIKLSDTKSTIRRPAPCWVSTTKRSTASGWALTLPSWKN